MYRHFILMVYCAACGLLRKRNGNDQAGLRKGAKGGIYRHFASKEELAAEAFD